MLTDHWGQFARPKISWSNYYKSNYLFSSCCSGEKGYKIGTTRWWGLNIHARYGFSYSPHLCGRWIEPTSSRRFFIHIMQVLLITIGRCVRVSPTRMFWIVSKITLLKIGFPELHFSLTSILNYIIQRIIPFTEIVALDNWKCIHK